MNEIVLGSIVGLVLLSGGTLAKNKVEDTLTTASDSFTKWDDLFRRYSAIYNVPFYWLKAIAMNESSLGEARSVKRGLENPRDIDGSKSSDGKSWGLMQVTLTTARDLDPSATEVQLNNPEYSIRLAAMYLSRLKPMFSMVDTRWEEWVIKSYNQGPGNTRKEIKGGKGYAEEYWLRFQRNRRVIREKQGE